MRIKYEVDINFDASTKRIKYSSFDNAPVIPRLGDQILGDPVGDDSQIFTVESVTHVYLENDFESEDLTHRISIRAAPENAG